MAKECEVTSKTYHEIRVVPAALRASGAMEPHGTFSETLGFYITDSLRTAAGVHIPNKEATLIIQGEIVTVTKKSGEIWVAGDAIFWLSGTTEFTNVNDGSGQLVGKAKIAAATGDATGDIVFRDYYPVQRGMQIGTALIPYKITAAFPDPIISLYAKSSVIGNIESLKVHTVLEGVGSTGGRALFKLSTEVALGGWANALKGIADFGANGSVGGLASGICGELIAATTPFPAGYYTALEAEIVMPTGAISSGGAPISHLFCGLGGDNKQAFLDGGYFLVMTNMGVASGDIFYVNTTTATLKCLIDSVEYFLQFHKVEAAT